MRISFRQSLVATLALIGVMIAPAAARAVTPGPAFAVRGDTKPTVIAPGTSGEVVVLVTNTGVAPAGGTPITVSDVLPHGLTVTNAEVFEQPNGGAHIPCLHTSSTVSCTYGGELAGDSVAGLEIEIGVTTEPDASGAAVNTVTVSGGGAAVVSEANSVVFGSQEPPFGLDGPFEASLYDPAGAVDSQAGDHPSSDTTGFVVNSIRNPITVGSFQPVREVKDIAVQLPAGFVGDPRAAATCPQYLLAPPSDGLQCPPASIVGSIAIQTQTQTWGISGPATATIKPLFNVVPEGGHPAQFAFIFTNQEATLYASLLHTAAGYVVGVSSANVLPAAHLTGVKVTLFGYPFEQNGGGTPRVPFFTNPTDCSAGPLVTTMHMDSWQNPASLPSNPDGSPDIAAANFEEPQWQEYKSESPPITGCNKLQFNPEFKAQPTSKQTSSPTGLNVNLEIPQDPDPTGLATAELKNATVTLPQGLSVSPSLANGLQACTNAQFAEQTTEPATCPEASQIGTVTAHTPILANALEGQLFIGAPECDPCSNADAQDGRLARVFLQVHSEEYGVTVKLPGSVSVDPSTGQLTATFRENPQVPIDHVELHFKSGERAPLSTPTACGSYASSVDLTPWSAPYTKDALLNPGFEITEGCGARGFAPSFSAGTVNPQAGAYSPFTLTFSRNDGEQYASDIEQTLPPGLLAKLAGVQRCGDAEANAGSCPAGSRIGSVTVAAGPGSDPYYVTGQIYLTGPYNGGPFGEAVIVQDVAGPFNLGTTVVRGSIRVNPSTAQATVVSDPFPSIIDGIPLQIRTVSVNLDREGFTFNPTNCAATAVTGKLVSTQGASEPVATRFQAANCGGLGFKPVLSAATAGRASKAGGASFDVKVSYPSGPEGTYANIKSVKVDLPKQLPSRLTTLQKACLAKVFEANPASCPAASDVGTATATTPLLNVPVSGPAYLVSHGGEAFPDLEIVLQGEGVTLILVGNTQIKKGITSSTFKAIPDAPVSGFELKLPTGKYSILGANVPASAQYSLCGQSLTMPTAITGQNGTPIKQNTKIAVTGCPKVKKATKKKAHKASNSTRRGK